MSLSWGIAYLCFAKLFSVLNWFSDINEVGRCAKANCEHTARSTPTLPDVVLTLVEMGKEYA